MLCDGRGWYRRGYLPHLDVSRKAVGITFRLADSVPAKLIETWKRELAGEPGAKAATLLAARIARFEDAGIGRCWLRCPEFAQAVADSLKHFDGERYRLIEWCVMPNHVHALASLHDGASLETVVRSWKNFTARRIHGILDRTGRFWAPDYFDRLIRDDDHLTKARRYVRMNPVQARLCRNPEDWKWGSAWRGEG